MEAPVLKKDKSIQRISLGLLEKVHKKWKKFTDIDNIDLEYQMKKNQTDIVQTPEKKEFKFDLDVNKIEKKKLTETQIILRDLYPK